MTTTTAVLIVCTAVLLDRITMAITVGVPTNSISIVSPTVALSNRGIRFQSDSEEMLHFSLDTSALATFHAPIPVLKLVIFFLLAQRSN